MSAKPTSIDGTWELIKAEMAGEGAPNELSQRTQLKVARGAYWVYFDGEVTDHGTCDLDDSGAVKTLELRGADGPNVGRRIPCIYQQTGDRLRICYGLEERIPTEFKTVAGQRHYLALYRRIPSGLPPDT